MKTTPSRYILAAEILTIFLFHAVKIRQAEKQPTFTDLTLINKSIVAPKPVMENKSVGEYMLVNLVK